MYYNIITAKNFDDIKTLCDEKKNSVLSGYKNDVWSNYGTVDFIIIGEKALQMFRENQGVKLSRYANTLKTDGKTSAEILPYIKVEYYFDARNGASGLVGFNENTEIRYLIKYNGVYLYYNSNNSCKPSSLSLFNDNTTYYGYLPYNWEKENPAPAKVGTITDKKMNVWFSWLQTRKQTAETEKENRENKIKVFLDKIRSFDSSKCSTFVVDEKRGYIDFNGVHYSYRIEDGVIYEDITLSSYNRTFDGFKALIKGF